MEAGNDRRLLFFDRDPLQWRDHPQGDLYRTLFALRRSRTALRNGALGARMVEVSNDRPAQVFSFVRLDAAGGVLVVLNLSRWEQTVSLTAGVHVGAWTDQATGRPEQLGVGASLTLPPWGWRLLIR
jgi:glycosidase